MSDVLFITPTFELGFRQESVGTLLLATILRNNGIDANVLPLRECGAPDSFEEFLNRVVDRVIRDGATIVSFYTRCDSYHVMLKIAERLKEVSPVYIVFGGPQADITALDTLQEFPYVDYVCQGEGESTVTPFFSSLLKKTPDHTTPGLVYRDNGRVCRNAKPAFVQDLDSLPNVDYSLVGLNGEQENLGFFPIDVGRGCPFSCTYCSTKTFWGRRYRLKSPKRVCEEIESLHRQFGITRFAFEHDMFTFNRDKVIEICESLRTLSFPVRWTCSARIDCLDHELIDIMVGAGMRRIFIGVETGSPRMQKIINKNLKLDNLRDIISYLVEKNVNVVTSFIYGFPEENEEDLSQTLSLIAEILKHKNTVVPTYLCTFLPGTELSVRFKDKMVTAIRPSNVTGTIALPECADLISEHPGVFGHFREYQTPLRAQLKYFSVFVNIWGLVQPVYQYLAEQYSCDGLIDMYRDFVEANRDTLLNTEDLSFSWQIRSILKDDQFAKRFAAPELQEVIQDCYRMATATLSDELTPTGSWLEIYSFSPKEFVRGSSVRDYRKVLTVVTYSAANDHTIKMTIRNRK